MIETTLLPCPACGESVPADDAFCEACGAPMAQLATALPPPRPSDACPGCGAAPTEIDHDGYCGACGARRTAQPRDHLGASLAGAAAVTDKGRRHHRNEDAFALAHHVGRGLRALVVCDGVSSSPQSDLASQAAADAACRRLAAVPEDATPYDREAAMTEAVRDAQQAVVAVAGGRTDTRSAPSCTYVGAVTGGGLITVGWVGDSRAYVLPPGGVPAEALTRDHSWLMEQLALGRAEADVAGDPSAHAITRWLGSDVDGTPQVDVRTLAVTAPARLLLCSDGLWNVATDAQIGAVAASVPSLVEAADALVAYANAAGGPDNITVILCDIGPSAPGEEPR